MAERDPLKTRRFLMNCQRTASSPTAAPHLENTMQHGSSLEAPSNVVTSSEMVTLTVDGHTVVNLSEAAEQADEWGCCMMMATSE